MKHEWPDLDTLELLVLVAELGSMGAAAHQVGMSQPAASRALARFERRCGLTLLERSPRGSRLTPQGTLLVDWSREVLDAAERLTLSAAALHQRHAAQLRVAASMTVAEYLVPKWLAGHRRAHPDVHVELAVMNSDHVIEHVALGKHDLGFVETTTIPSQVQHQVIARDELHVVVERAHPWARRRSPLTLTELASTPLVLREHGSGTRRALEDAAGRRGLQLVPPAQEMSSNAAVRIAAAAGVAPAGGADPGVTEVSVVASPLAVGDSTARWACCVTACILAVDPTIAGVVRLTASASRPIAPSSATIGPSRTDSSGITREATRFGRFAASAPRPRPRKQPRANHGRPVLAAITPSSGNAAANNSEPSSPSALRSTAPSASR